MSNEQTFRLKVWVWTWYALLDSIGEKLSILLTYMSIDEYMGRFSDEEITNLREKILKKIRAELDIPKILGTGDIGEKAAESKVDLH